MIHIRPADKRDAPTVFPWRNSENVRKSSLSSQKINWEAHNAWFNASLLSQEKRLFMIESQNMAVGCLRFDFLENDAVEISIYLDPLQCGKGYGKEGLLQGIAWLSNAGFNFKKIIAKILPENVISKALFQSVGFNPKYEVFELELT